MVYDELLGTLGTKSLKLKNTMDLWT